MPIGQDAGHGNDQNDDDKTDFDFKVLHTYLFGTE
jgi:hypothetical protein